jgi:hypothetical protein
VPDTINPVPDENQLQGSVTEWSDHALDTFVAPELSKFTEASIPDVSTYNQSREWWVRNFFLNSMLRVTVASPYRQYMLNFLRRAELCFREYELARERTLRYLENPRNRGTGHYVAAIGHWEVFLSQAWHAYLLFSFIDGRNGKGIFKRGDGSEEERLNFLYNSSKHAETTIEGDSYPAESTLCLWLYNDGLKVTSTSKIDGHLTFAEMFGMLEDFAKWADRVQDPATLREKIVRDSVDPDSGR